MLKLSHIFEGTYRSPRERFLILGNRRDGTRVLPLASGSLPRFRFVRRRTFRPCWPCPAFLRLIYRRAIVFWRWLVMSRRRITLPCGSGSLLLRLLQVYT